MIDRDRLPTKKDIDRPLIIGAAIFGIGWGIAGYCPGEHVNFVRTDELVKNGNINENKGRNTS
jgi:hypothetical protein